MTFPQRRLWVMYFKTPTRVDLISNSAASVTTILLNDILGWCWAVPKGREGPWHHPPGGMQDPPQSPMGQAQILGRAMKARNAQETLIYTEKKKTTVLWKAKLFSDIISIITGITVENGTSLWLSYLWGFTLFCKYWVTLPAVKLKRSQHLSLGKILLYYVKKIRPTRTDANKMR